MGNGLPPRPAAVEVLRAESDDSHEEIGGAGKCDVPLFLCADHLFAARVVALRAKAAAIGISGSGGDEIDDQRLRAGGFVLLGTDGLDGRDHRSAIFEQARVERKRRTADEAVGKRDAYGELLWRDRSRNSGAGRRRRSCTRTASSCCRTARTAAYPRPSWGFPKRSGARCRS